MASSAARPEPRIQAFWLEAAHGYHLEARVPLSLRRTRGSGSRPGTVRARPRGSRCRIRRTADGCSCRRPGSATCWRVFIRAGTRATVVDANGLKLGVTGHIQSTAGDEEEADADATWYRRFVSVDTSSWPLMASSPDRVTGKSVAAALAGHPAAEWLRAPAESGIGADAPPRRSGSERTSAAPWCSSRRAISCWRCATGH